MYIAMMIMVLACAGDNDCKSLVMNICACRPAFSEPDPKVWYGEVVFIG